MAAPHRDAATLNVLFVGNSFTARNDLPSLIAALAQTRGKRMERRLISAGGASLRRHWNAGEALTAIQESRYDCVVLQEQSTLPIKSPKRMHESIRLFDKAIQESGATTVLYLTWARQQAPETQQVITDAYTSIADELGATVAPVGIAWENFLSKHSAPPLHDKDDSHPTLAGSYLTACIFLSVLFGETSVGIKSDVEGLAVTDRNLLQKSAWQTYQAFTAKGRR